ncbi:amidophosphoribosyltransferase [Thermomonas sp.]|jgi:amidophosphoribosyltransferase|uniref:amidophosphoribosyltransferase n=1 Tax=Thermomonas sp. TaxID=1971895 RepID=UPI001B3F47A9|nr:amidophosphoribosyltransferase [Thermomonas sp.]MBL0227856.1 amidophosphoribosyltransferase [Thermomonas sp.]MBP6438565.1 amidophosphoribosyltransferase [Thermomonas sp.]MBP7157854.1 amidophosphoribosyltransferase [Thermomonas sp.]MBP7787508.1 amidophosphoribosyltransferase [Thermomonas sp.]MBP8648624.1 amidophosphoribosyltransferase [Thermomonas sp.]
MCGIVGIVGQGEVAAELYDGLTVLQHRGQDAAGIATADGGKLRVHKGNGLVRDVFDATSMALLSGRVGIAHCRYPTAGSEGSDEAQPFYVNSPFGIALAHNGNLVNTDALRREVFEQDRRNVNTESDSEVLLNVFAHELDSQGVLTPDAVFRALEGVNRRAKGGYAVVCTVLGLGLVAFRDPNGIRPLVLGKRTANGIDEYIVASESVALDVLGFERLRDVAPGEGIVITARGELFAQQCAPPLAHAPCIFEFVYFARPDSMIEEISVHKARMRMGVTLGEKILRERPGHDIDVVIPIPDTSRDAALEIASVLGVKYREGFIKNRYVGRTFIMPGQGERAKSVKRKLNPIPLEFRNRVVLLVDDSIVRGTTSQQIVQMARDAGARKVYLASAAPPVRYPNIYGIDMPSSEELVAHDRSEREIEQLLGCDWLVYQDLADLEAAVAGPKFPGRKFDSSCFSGEYVTGIEAGYFERLQQLRSDEAKKKRRAS